MLSSEPIIDQGSPTKSFSDILDLSRNETGEVIMANLLENFKSTEEYIKLVAELTSGQSDNALWHQMRIGRLTASNFGVVLGACRRNR